nr:hypothetical protein [Streptococcus anginosus]
LGLLTEPVDQVRAQARLERERMLARLREHGLLGEQPSEREIVEALHRYVARTPAALIAVALVRSPRTPGPGRSTPR